MKNDTLTVRRVVTPATLLAFAKTISGRILTTVGQQKRFRVECSKGEIQYTPESSARIRLHSEKSLASICAHYRESGSFRAADYKGLSANAPYTLALITEFLKQSMTGSPEKTNLDREDRILDLVRDVQAALHPGLLEPEYVSENRRNPMFGHCYRATEAVYYLLKESGELGSYKPRQAKDERGVSHWWLQNDLGEIIDPTADQYLSQGRTPPYERGRRRPFRSPDVSHRTKELIDLVNDRRQSG